MRILFITFITVISIAAANGAEGDPISVVAAKAEFEPGETIEVTVTNVSEETVYLIPVFASYPYEYFYPPDNYLELLENGYWRPVYLVRPGAFYDKRMLFFELGPGDQQALSAPLSDFDEGLAKAGGTFRAAVTAVVDPPSPIVAWADFEEYREGRQLTVKSGEFSVKGAEEK